jgi:hypothetical protein
VPTDLIGILQQRQARLAIGSSSMRGRGNTGVVHAARAHLATLDLRPFGTARAKAFSRALDEATDDLRLALPRAARHWGLARKGLNIFLRECLYCSYLREHFALGRGEEFYEIPLDSITAAHLRRVPAATLPRWPGVKHVDAQASVRFQAVAAREARARGFARVHLDALWWGAIDRTSEV